MYKTIGVGSDRSLDTSFYDDTGVNIAHLNPYINECTAIYWAWKNTNSEYVGINHYRRYFYNTSVKQRDNVLSKEKIQDIFQNEKVDIILSEMKNLKVSLFENICNSVDDRSLCEMALKCVKKVMYQRVPEYMDAFEYVMKGNSFYKCNVFVTRRDIFEQYCSWLFSFITDVAEEFDVSSYGKKQKRVIGYFAEGMLSVWLLKQTLRIKELPLSETIGNDV
jgi:hypothetical protein